MLSNTEKAFTLRGEAIQVDISPEACGKFGFFHDDRITSDRLGLEGVVVGVAPPPLVTAHMKGCREALWVRLALNRGAVTCFTDPSVDFARVSMTA